MERRRVVITGMGAKTPIGLTAEESWEAAKAGKCGIAPITQYDTTNMKAKLAGEVKGFDPALYMDKRDARKMDRFAQLALAAAVEAVEASGLDFSAEDPYRCGVVMACGIGGLTTMQRDCIKGETKGYDKISPFFIPMAIGNMAAAHVSIKYGLKGMTTCPVTACASGTNAVGDAMRQIRDGYAEVVVCGGAEAVINELAMGGFTSMHALCTSEDPSRASIPFDAERSGFVMGEGAGALVLRSWSTPGSGAPASWRKWRATAPPATPTTSPPLSPAERAAPRPWPSPWPTPGWPRSRWGISTPTAPPPP